MDEEGMLSAREGADRVWQRRKEKGLKWWAPNDPIGVDDESVPTYTCENCGEHEFVVVYSFNEQQHVRWTLPCSCGATDIAATEDYLMTQGNRWIGRLDEEHRVPSYDEKDIEEVDRELEDSEILCEECDETTPFDWTSEEVDEWETDETSEYFEVGCADCGHDSEFGWSHPDRGGRIWPCESKDFEPGHCIPEKRFFEDWARRDWLRPRKNTSRST